MNHFAWMRRRLGLVRRWRGCGGMRKGIGREGMTRREQDEGPDGSWVHAYLHRKEGDLSNAGYWYERAGRKPATSALADEWDQIAGELLK